MEFWMTVHYYPMIFLLQKLTNMKCINKKYYWVDLDPHLWMLFSNYERFENIPTKTNYVFSYSNPHLSFFNDHENMVINWYDEPNCLQVNNINRMHDLVIENDLKIYKLLTPCKYSVECYNKLYSTNKWTQVFYPFNIEHLPKIEEKIYDVYYTGNGDCPIRDIFSIIRKYKSCFVCHNYGDHRGVSYNEKLSLNAKSKISITHGVLSWPNHLNHIADEYPTHKGLELIKSHGIAPQFKTRNLEAAAAKSLILHKKDPWNEIEDYFTPDVDFIHWTNGKDLEDKICYILAHYDEFIPMIDRAYNKLINNFTTEQYFDKFLKNL